MYNAILTKIQNIRPHNNADRLDVSSIYWNQVIVAKWTQIWELWVFFPIDGRLWENFCTQNNLIRRKDESGNIVWGMFDENRKIRCQKLRWERSEWFRVPISYFDYLNYDFSQHNEWYMFNTIWKEKLCDKFISDATVKSKGAYSTNKWATKRFPKHLDTSNIKYYRPDIKKWDLVTLTIKLHWTSQRSWYVLNEVKTPRRNIRKKHKIEYEHVVGSRNVIVSSHKNDWYHSTSFRMEANKKFEFINKWELFFYEIVWYEWLWSPIMWKVFLNSLDKDTEKELLELWMPKQMEYSYWCEDGMFETYVYRVATVNEDWIMYELPRSSVKERCNSIWVKVCPELHQEIFDGDLDRLKLICNAFYDWPDLIDNKHRREWIVIRIDKRNWWTEFYKYKNFTFLSLEDKQKSANVVDIEESS